MSDDNNKLKLVFSEMFYEELEALGVSKEEAQEVIDEITAAFESGELMDNAMPLTEEGFVDAGLFPDDDDEDSDLPTLH